MINSAHVVSAGLYLRIIDIIDFMSIDDCAHNSIFCKAHVLAYMDYNSNNFESFNQFLNEICEQSFEHV